MQDLKEFGKKYVKENIGEHFVDDFVSMYDALNNGESIGNFVETASFLMFLDNLKQAQEKEVRQDTCGNCRWLQRTEWHRKQCWMCTNKDRHRYFANSDSVDIRYLGQRACRTGFEPKEEK